jgi:lipopolysaccharide transport system ATP-binding protein
LPTSSETGDRGVIGSALNHAIHAEGISKRYRIGTSARYKALRDTLAESLSSPFRALRCVAQNGAANKTDGLTADTIWALKDVSFVVRSGEVLGVVGRNGAGKSTLLKVLSRITSPTEGQVQIRGRVGSLLEVGTGFHPELTGRENIYLNGAILGMRKAEIDRRFGAIVEFAEIQPFLDTPVKHYSSGMHMRLAFSVAAHLEPEILLIDEVLAVGDFSFQRKCLGKMGEISRGGRTVVFVSHNMAAVRRLCSRVLWLKDGRSYMDGPTGEVIPSYLRSESSSSGARCWPEGLSNRPDDELKISGIRVADHNGRTSAELSIHERWSVEIRYHISAPLNQCRVGFELMTPDGITLIEAYDSDNEAYGGPRAVGEYVSRCDLPADMLSPGSYSLSINAGTVGVKNFAYVQGALEVRLIDTAPEPAYTQDRAGVLRPRLKWKADAVA